MDSLRGVVHTLHTTGGNNPIATFMLDDATVQINAAPPVSLAEGDEVSVLGPRKSGILIAYAYCNHTQGTRGGARGQRMLIYSSVFILLTLLLGIVLRAWNNADTALIIGLMLAGGASYVSLGLRIRKAMRILFRQQAPENS